MTAFGTRSQREKGKAREEWGGGRGAEDSDEGKKGRQGPSPCFPVGRRHLGRKRKDYDD